MVGFFFQNFIFIFRGLEAVVRICARLVLFIIFIIVSVLSVARLMSHLMPVLMSSSVVLIFIFLN